MSLKPLLSFSSGELDPILHDLVTLARFNKGLATARNSMIGKTGSILSRFSRAHFVKAKNNGEAVRLFSPPNSGILTEWGNLYVRVYDFSGSLIIELAHVLLESDLPNMHFVSSSDSIYVFTLGKEVLQLFYTGVPVFQPSFNLLIPTAGPSSMVITATGVPSGYGVDYLVTAVKNGEESSALDTYAGAFNKPLAAGQDNTLIITSLLLFSIVDQYTEFRVYRRPTNGAAFGYIGSTNKFYDVAGDLTADFIDLGGDADFTNGPPLTVTKNGLEGKLIRLLYSKTGIIYQQRLLISTEDDDEAIIASRPGFQNNFERDFPFSSDSALKFKSGTSGNAKVLRMLDKDGLIVFTAVGVWVSVGALSINNLALEKRGGWVIKESIPPLVVPGGVFFVSEEDNTVQQLVFSRDIQTYESKEQSIFSSHLFKNRTIESWAYQSGVVPIIIVTFSDGSFATFTYQAEHEMRAWTRHDSVYPVEQCEGTGTANATFFVTNKGGDRYIEVSLPRHAPAATQVSNPESDKIGLNALMDGLVTTSNLLNDSLAGSDIFLLVPVTPNDWEGDLTLTCGTSGIFTVGTFGAVDTEMKFFDVTDRSEVNLVVKSRASDNQVVVVPSAEFPSAQASDFRLYETFNQVTGLTHLEGENVAIMLDGYVIASPNNDVENYATVTVTAGVAVIPDGQRGAIIIVGRPITADVKTLNISTVEQSPTTLESLNVNKMYIRINETRGLFIANDFPEVVTGGKDGSSIIDMEDLTVQFNNPQIPIIGNRYKPAVSDRLEKILNGNWNNQGQIAIRQVDCLHFEILSIIPDLEVSRRSSR